MFEQGAQAVSNTNYMEVLKACDIEHLLSAKASEYFHFPNDYPKIFQFQDIIGNCRRVYGYSGNDIILFETTSETITESSLEDKYVDKNTKVINTDLALMLMNNLKVVGIINKFDMTTKSLAEITSLFENPIKCEDIMGFMPNKYVHKNIVIECGKTYNEIFVCTKSLRVAFFGREFEPHFRTKFEHIDFGFPRNYTGIRETYDVYYGHIEEIYMSVDGFNKGVVKFRHLNGKVVNIIVLAQERSDTKHEIVEKVQDVKVCNTINMPKDKRVIAGLISYVRNVIYKKSKKNDEIPSKEIIDSNTQKPSEEATESITTKCSFKQLNIDIPHEECKDRTLKFDFDTCTFNLCFSEGRLVDITMKYGSPIYGYAYIDLRNSTHMEIFNNDNGLLFTGIASYNSDSNVDNYEIFPKHLVQFELSISHKTFKLKCSAIKDDAYAKIFDRPIKFAEKTYCVTDDISVNSTIGHIVGNLDFNIPFDVSVAKL